MYFPVNLVNLLTKKNISHLQIIDVTDVAKLCPPEAMPFGSHAQQKITYGKKTMAGIIYKAAMGEKSKSSVAR